VAFVSSGGAKPVGPPAGHQYNTATAAPPGHPADRHAKIRRPGEISGCI